MNPSTELRLKSMMRAVSENIMPAIDPANSIAQEQAGLLLGHINALIQQQGKEPEIDQQELEALQKLGSALLSSAEGGEQTMQCITNLKQAMEGSCVTTLSLAVENLIIAQDASEAFKSAAWQPVLDYSGDAAARGREWFKPMGF